LIWSHDSEGATHAREVRGIVDHGFIHSIYFRDPNGYVIELTCRTGRHDKMMDPAENKARAILDRWTRAKLGRAA